MSATRRVRVFAASALGVAVLPIGCGSSAPRPAVAPSPSTSAVGVISETDLDHMRAARVEQLIAGRVPGVQVARTPDGGYAILIRGSKSFGSGEPLYVIDGMPLPGRSFGHALTGIAPDDISRIEVLKDAGATAAYGSQGANGVILITTKRHR